MGKFLTAGRRLGTFAKLRRFFTLGILLFFFLVIFLNAIIISIEARDITPGLQEIGGRLLFATENLRERSLLITEQGGVFDPSKGFFGRTWDIITTYSDFVADFIVIYLWIKILSFFVMIIFTGDRSRVTANLLLGITAFFILQMFVIIIAEDPGKIMSPFLAFVDFFRALPHVISPIANVADTLIGGGDVNLTELNNVTNNLTA